MRYAFEEPKVSADKSLAASQSVTSRYFLGTLLHILIGLILFVAAGTIKIPLFWAFLIVSYLIFLAGIMPVLARDPRLRKERAMRIKKKGIAAFLNRYQVTPNLIYLVAGLDVGRFHWSDSVPLPLSLAGLALVGVGAAIFVWSISTNTFFSSQVRIQHELGHHVVTVGPYRLVRHPGYFGLILNYLGSCLALGSWLAFLPALATAIVFIARTSKEDRFLQEELDGYQEYSARVRYRLLPAIW